MSAFGVWATPQKDSFFGDLLPRFQMFNTGEIASYATRESAEDYARTCRADRNWKWTAEVHEIVDTPFGPKVRAA